MCVCGCVCVCLSQSTVPYLPNYTAGTLGLLCLSLIFYFPSLAPFLFSKSPSDSSVSPLLLYHSVTLSLLVPCSALSLLHSPSSLCSGIFRHHFYILVLTVCFHVPIFTVVRTVHQASAARDFHTKLFTHALMDLWLYSEKWPYEVLVNFWFTPG